MSLDQLRTTASVTENLDTPFGLPLDKAAEIVPGSRDTLYKLIAAGELESYTVGRRRIVTVRSIRSYHARRLAAETAKRAATSPMEVA
jgi:excisionase family DNA binding protein